MALLGRGPRNEMVSSLGCNPSKDKRSDELSTDWLITKAAQNLHPDRLTLLKSRILLRVECVLDPFEGEARYQATEGCEIGRMWEEEPEGEGAGKLATCWRHYCFYRDLGWPCLQPRS